MHKDFLSVADYSTEELKKLLDLAKQMKANPKEYREVLKGKTLGMIFEKNSTRTRVSFEVGIYQLGGVGLFFGPNQLQLSRGEPISDTAAVLSRYLDGIMIRTFSHQDVLDLAKYSTIPVINGLTDYNHPCQAMADMQTVIERFGKTEGLKLAYVGDGNNVAVSLLNACVKLGMHCSLVSPKKYTMPQVEVKKVQQEADKKKLKICLTENVEEGVAGAHVIYTDVWASMGQEKEREQRLRDFAGFTVDKKVMSYADKSAIFMHCLPAHRGEEVAVEVIDGPQSAIFDEAENRLHAQKAIMYQLMKD
jgi:ornithine carbamoyltransferase